MRFLLLVAALVLTSSQLSAEQTKMVLRDDIVIPELPNFKPLPADDAELTEKLRVIVEELGLDQMTPADKSPDGKDEWSSICVVDLSDLTAPRVAGWKADNFVYPASTYKMYAMGEAIRQVTTEELDLATVYTIKDHNVRSGSKPVAGEQMTLSEIIRLTIQYSDNTTANELIDIVDRQRISALMHALGCQGSEVTRKYLPRASEDEGYENIASTVTSARHLATFLYAVETGAIGGGKGRGLIKGYLATNDKGRFDKGVPETATVYSKTGWWSAYTSDASLIEDGEVKFILCALTVIPSAEADAKLLELSKRVHALLAASK